MTQDELKALVGLAALAYVVPGSVVGVGTGSTVNCFIDALAGVRIAGAVSSSEQSSERLRARGIAVLQAHRGHREPRRNGCTSGASALTGFRRGPRIARLAAASILYAPSCWVLLESRSLVQSDVPHID